MYPKFWRLLPWLYSCTHKNCVKVFRPQRGWCWEFQLASPTTERPLVFRTLMLKGLFYDVLRKAFLGNFGRRSRSNKRLTGRVGNDYEDAILETSLLLLRMTPAMKVILALWLVASVGSIAHKSVVQRHQFRSSPMKMASACFGIGEYFQGNDTQQIFNNFTVDAHCDFELFSR